MRRSVALSVLLILLMQGLSRAAVAQRRKADGPVGATQVAIDAKLGGKRYHGNGSGECRHAPDASIRGTSASLWTVSYASAQDGSLKELSLRLWRPKDGNSDQLSLSVETKSGAHRIEMGAGQSSGEATVTILPSGPGGRLEISGKEAGGKPVQITIECTDFVGIEGEGD
jgi:hypothetical protein